MFIMACGKTIFLAAVLAILAVVRADEGSGSEIREHEHGDEIPQHERMSFQFPGFGLNANMGGLSGIGDIFGGLGSNGSSNPFGQLLSMFSQFMPNGNSSGIPMLPFMSNLQGSREGQDHSHHNVGEEGSATPSGYEEGSQNERMSFQFPEFLGSSNGSQNPFGQFLSAFSQFIPNAGSSNGTGSSGQFPFLPFQFSRQSEVHPDELPEAEESPENRLFFGSLFGGSSTYTSCNYTTQPGSRCLSCTQALTCYASNVGRLRSCRFLKPYCNNGFCSKFPGPACFSSSTATTAAATTTTG